jgi:ribonuclease VapC
VREIAVDSSAVTAMLLREPDAETFLAEIGRSRTFLSAPTLVELHSVALRRLGPDGPGRVDDLVSALAIGIAPFDAAQATLARDALVRFGRGRREPPAVLNFGDAFSYALAKARGLPLLYKGADFAQTDVAAALPA